MAGGSIFGSCYITGRKLNSSTDVAKAGQGIIPATLSSMERIGTHLSLQDKIRKNVQHHHINADLRSGGRSMNAILRTQTDYLRKRSNENQGHHTTSTNTNDQQQQQQT